MLSNAEREYLKNPSQYGHYPRVLRTRIRKKIKQALQDLILVTQAEEKYIEWNPKDELGEAIEDFDSISDPLAGPFIIKSTTEKDVDVVLAKFSGIERGYSLIVVFVPKEIDPVTFNRIHKDTENVNQPNKKAVYHHRYASETRFESKE